MHCVPCSAFLFLVAVVEKVREGLEVADVTDKEAKVADKVVNAIVSLSNKVA